VLAYNRHVPYGRGVALLPPPDGPAVRPAGREDTVVSATTDVQFVPPIEERRTSAPSTPEQSAVGQSAEIQDRIEAAKLEIYATRGWTRADKNGKIVPDDVLAKNAVYELFRDSVVINSEAEIVDDGLGQADLYAKIFPGAPSEPMDDERHEAYQQVKRKLWQWAGTGIKNHCQETCEMEGRDYVMVEKKVFRASRDMSTGTVAPTGVIVRFFTSDPDLIFELSSQPAAAKFVKAAEEAAKHLEMNTRRHPELTTRVAREAQASLKRSAAHLTPLTSVKPNETRALSAGSDD
jgi:hypothetical protein